MFDSSVHKMICFALLLLCLLCGWSLGPYTLVLARVLQVNWLLL